jgi:uncharacterized membrane protein (UPF0127 family)
MASASEDLQTSCTRVIENSNMKLYRIRNMSTGTVLAEHAALASDSKTRRTGLLKHDNLPDGKGLIIRPCEGIHTFGMRFPIDVVFISKKWKVLKTVSNLPRRRIALWLLADSVVELPAGTLERTNTTKGDQLSFESVPANMQS